MNENTDSRQLLTELRFTLDIRSSESPSRKLEVFDRVLAGLDPRNDLILIDPLITPKYFLFRRRNNVLSLHYLGRDGDCSLNDQPLEKGKLYILDKGDRLKVGKIEIIIRREVALKQTQSKSPLPSSNDNEADWNDVENISTDMTESLEAEPESDEEEEIPSFVEMKLPNSKAKTNSHYKTEKWFLMLYRFYGFFIDLAFTYFIFSTLVDSLGLTGLLQGVLFYLSQFISLNFEIIHQYKILSFVEFGILFHSLMITCAIIIGNTPGAFILGITNDSNSSLFAKRLSAIMYALINCLVLPIFFLDLPLFKGKSIKEIITFSEFKLHNKNLTSMSRKLRLVFLIVICFAIPLNMVLFNDIATNDTHKIKPVFKDVHTLSINSLSSELGLKLTAELNQQYMLLPLLSKKSLGLIVYDKKNHLSLILKEENRMSFAHFLFNLRFLNPLGSLMFDPAEVNSQKIKSLLLECLNLNLGSMPNLLKNYGPFIAAFPLQQTALLSSFHFHTTNALMINSYSENNPVIRIGQSHSEHYLLITKKEIIDFSVFAPKKSAINEVLSQSIFQSMTFTKTNEENKIYKIKVPQILEVFEAFERNQSQAILTYYANEANKIKMQNKTQPDTQETVESLQVLKNNVAQNKIAFRGKKNIETAFDQLLNSL